MEKDDLIPDFIKYSGLNFNWNKNKLWKLENIPIEDIDISEIEWQLDLPFWHDNKNKYSIHTQDPLLIILKIIQNTKKEY